MIDVTGGPAFPDAAGEGGMSMVDWFAGRALTGMLAAGRSVLEETLVEDAYHVGVAMVVARDGFLAIAEHEQEIRAAVDREQDVDGA